MTTFARIRNATGTVEDYRQETDDWSVPRLKFGGAHVVGFGLQTP